MPSNPKNLAVSALPRISLCILLGFLPVLTKAQETKTHYPSGRPKLGLTLSGGGAKGFAHIGVLKVLEEVGLRPDYITGTSMGSIVGGLYSLGYSADSLHTIVREQDWGQVLSDDLFLEEVVFEEKLYFNNEFLELPIDGWVVRPPSGLIEGQQIMELLNYLTLPAYHINDFSKLPIPFRCVAADVVTGKFVVLDKGHLAEAMRTSMAIPTVFTAVQSDTMVLVDGGFIRNFPVKEVVDMGAQRVIGAYTGAVRKGRDQLYSFNQILGQLAFLMSLEDAQEQLPYLDIYIEPDLTGFSAGDFNRYEAIIQAGEDAARDKIEYLRELASELDQYGSQPEVVSLPTIENIVIDEVRIIGNTYLSDDEIIGRAQIAPGDVVPVDGFSRILDNLYGTNLFETVTYSLQKEEDANVLVINCKEKLTRLLRTALIYDSYTNAGFLFNISLRNTFLEADRLMLTSRITDHYRVNLNYLKYLNRDRDIMAFGDWLLQKDRLPLLQEGVEQSSYRMISSRIELGIKKRYGSNFLLTLAGDVEDLEFEPLSGPDALEVDQINGTIVQGTGRVEWNSLNSNVFPERGAYFMLEGGAVFDSEFTLREHQTDTPVAAQDSVLPSGNYGKVRMVLDGFIPVNRRASIRISPFVGAVFNLRNNFSEFFLLGGPQPVSSRSIPFFGLDPHELPVQLAFGLRLGYQHFLTDNLMISLDGNAGFFGLPDELDTSALPNADIFLGGGQLSFGYKTIVGPLRLSLMYPFDADAQVESKLRTYLTFGYRF